MSPRLAQHPAREALRPETVSKTFGRQLFSATGGFWITALFNGAAHLAAVIFSKRQQARRAKTLGQASTRHPMILPAERP